MNQDWPQYSSEQPSSDFKVLRMCHFKQKEGVHGKLAKRRETAKKILFCVCVNKTQWWMKHPKYHPRDISWMAPWDGIFFSDEMGWAALFERKPDADSFFSLPASQLGRRTPAVSPAFSQSHWELRRWCWLRAVSLKPCLTFLHLSVSAVEALKWVSVSAPVGLVSVT